MIELYAKITVTPRTDTNQEVAINVNRTNIQSIDVKLTDRGDLKLPSFGIISNAGSLSYIDSNGATLELATQNRLQEGNKCEIFLKNTLVPNKSESIAILETAQWDYDNESKIVDVSLQDELVEWQSINVDAVSYDPTKADAKPLSWFYRHLWGSTKPNYDMLSFDELDDDTKAMLSNTKVRYQLLKNGTLWQQWTKLCEVGLSHIYKGKDGRIVYKYNGGN